MNAVTIERIQSRVRFPHPIRVALAASALTLGLGGVTGGVLTSSACTTTTTINAALISGIIINTDLLIGSLNCGTAYPDIYKYVAVVVDDTRTVGGAGIFDCYANGAFANLPGTDGGALNFAVWIYAYNKADYDAANADNALVNAVTQVNGVNQPDGSVALVPISVVPDGGSSKRGVPGALSTICLTKATWVATCSATAQDTVQALANCGPLSLQDAAASSCNLPLLLPEAGVDAASAASH